MVWVILSHNVICCIFMAPGQVTTFLPPPASRAALFPPAPVFAVGFGPRISDGPTVKVWLCFEWAVYIWRSGFRAPLPPRRAGGCRGGNSLHFFGHLSVYSRAGRLYPRF